MNGATTLAWHDHLFSLRRTLQRARPFTSTQSGGPKNLPSTHSTARQAVRYASTLNCLMETGHVDQARAYAPPREASLGHNIVLENEVGC
mmetsp:Transcript_9789/g.29942  ORF Transcript_9789/g.29942 Transcript_9789/m.29942 type:complete len:90 (-) Transcript_9789:63-332(-)|eukprot:scaffold305552_cov26-Tisochrysis_lutea.AAC.1